MLRSALLSIWLLLSLSIVAQTTVIQSRNLKTINESDIRKHINVLTSDSLAGRGTAEPGGEKAVEYIEQQFKKIGLLPYQNQSYRQEFNLWKREWKDVHVTVNGSTYLNYKTMLYLGKMNQNEPVEKEVVFAGNGSDEWAEQVDVNGKIAFVLMDNMRSWYAIYKRFEQKGAWAVFAINPGNEKQFAAIRDQYKGYFGPVSVSTQKPEMPESGSRFFIFNSDFASQIWSRPISELPKEPTKETLHTTATIKCELIIEPAPIYNVIGVLKGTNPEAKALAITAHYDHLGKNGDDIFRGADDNASGVTSLFEVAEALKHKKSKPLRDVLFIACAAEEKGLIGSAHFTSDPEVRSKIAANLNVDMIGRVDTAGKSNYIYIVGSEKSPWLHELHQRANQQTVNLTLDYSQSKYLAYSDHYNFHRYGIPVIGFFSGLHDDYHTIRDTADKLDYQLLQKRIQLVFATAFLIANEPEPVAEPTPIQ